MEAMSPSSSPPSWRAAAHGRAPGKVILLGEHAVVYGRPAIAATIDRWVEVELKPLPNAATRSVDDDHLAAALTRAAHCVGVDVSGLTVQIASDLPRAMGLGSSAAVSVALLRALAARSGRHLHRAELNAFAFEVETIFHGTPSGVDNSAVAYGGVIGFRQATDGRPQVRALSMAHTVPLVIALGRTPRQTKQTVAALRQRWAADLDTYERRFDEIEWLVIDAERAIAHGDLEELGLLLNTNHALLHGLGVSTDEIETMVTLARARGALGAKLTGGGGGGAIICLCGDRRESLVQAFTSAGWQAFATDITDGGRGADGRNDAARNQRCDAARS